MLSWPVDSHITGTDMETNLPLMDRAVDSATLQMYTEKMFTSGIMPNIARNLEVTPGTGMQVIVNKGVCIVGGAIGINPKPRTMTIQASELNLDRIDTIVARKDNTDNYRSVDLYVKKGVPSTAPVPAELTNPKRKFLVHSGLFVAESFLHFQNFFFLLRFELFHFCVQFSEEFLVFGHDVTV